MSQGKPSLRCSSPASTSGVLFPVRLFQTSRNQSFHLSYHVLGMRQLGRLHSGYLEGQLFQATRYLDGPRRVLRNWSCLPLQASGTVLECARSLMTSHVLCSQINPGFHRDSQPTGARRLVSGSVIAVLPPGLVVAVLLTEPRRCPLSPTPRPWKGQFSAEGSFVASKRQCRNLEPTWPSQ